MRGHEKQPAPCRFSTCSCTKTLRRYLLASRNDRHTTERATRPADHVESDLQSTKKVTAASIPKEPSTRPPAPSTSESRECVRVWGHRERTSRSAGSRRRRAPRGSPAPAPQQRGGAQQQRTWPSPTRNPIPYQLSVGLIAFVEINTIRQHAPNEGQQVDGRRLLPSLLVNCTTAFTPAGDRYLAPPLDFLGGASP